MAEHVKGAPIGPDGYVHYKCRCEACVEAYMALGSTPRERRRNGPTPAHVHGTWNGYSNYGCKCDRCLQACRDTTKEYGVAWRRVNRPALRARRREKFHQPRV